MLRPVLAMSVEFLVTAEQLEGGKLVFCGSVKQWIEEIDVRI